MRIRQLHTVYQVTDPKNNFAIEVTVNSRDEHSVYRIHVDDEEQVKEAIREVYKFKNKQK